MHSFLAEIMAIMRAHVATLGGNALVSYKLTECILEDNIHKNQVKEGTEWIPVHMGGVSFHKKFKAWKQTKSTSYFCTLG